MTRRLSLLAAGLLAAALGGCSEPYLGPSAGQPDPYPAPVNDPRVSVLAPELQQWLAFHPALVTRRAPRPMRVEVPVRNMTDRKYLVDYRVLFYDDRGFQLEPVMGWEPAVLYPRQIVRLAGGAMDTEALDWRLEMKWSR